MTELERQNHELGAENEMKDKLVAEMRKDLEYNKYQNQRGEERVNNLKDELRALERHQETVEGQNRQLLSEMENFAS